ncbi:Art5 protein [Saccharomycopsis crataegensis]|uniref:Art5 protein n=1 Tax=Saccharomycopsis crataegensis TaxID=43959 RepID=A0AAV5QJK8_9ASCO|nr:Art5 protein [Saccharomycopsis crataegensis]
MFSRHHHNDLILFDVRLKSTFKDMILLKGSEVDSPAYLVEGSVVFSLAAPIPVKKVTLRLTGTFKLEFFEVIKENGSQHSIPVKEEKALFHCYWENLLVDSQGEIKILDGQQVHGATNQQDNATDNINAEDDNNNSVPEVDLENSTYISDLNLSDSGPESHKMASIRKNKSSSALNLGFKTKTFMKYSHSSSNLITLSDSSNVFGTPFHELSKLNDEALEGKTFMLPAGNYDLPFKIIIPGTISETVEGLKGGSILYKFQATLQKGNTNHTYQPNLKFYKSSGHTGSNKITKNRYVRVFRTLPPETLLVPESLSISNIWPSKVQYAMSILSKHVSIGSKFAIDIKLIPLMKYLRLGKISLSVIEYYAYKGKGNEIYDDNHRVVHKIIEPSIDDDLYKLHTDQIDDAGDMENQEAESATTNVAKMASSDDEVDTIIKINQDSWQVKTFLQIPSKLKDVTQDCDLKNDLIKVRHKLKLKVSLMNPDSHVSELRANLPIVLFINPNVNVYGRYVAMDNTGKTHFRSLEDSLFTMGPSSDSEGARPTSPGIIGDNALGGLNQNDPYSENSMLRNNNGHLFLNELSVPPDYQHHVYDRKFDPNKPAFPEDSLQSTNGQSDDDLRFSTERQREDASDSTSTPVPGTHTDPSPSTGGLTPSSSSTHPLIRKVSIEQLSKVPSYHEAIEGFNSSFNNFQLAPLYESERAAGAEHSNPHGSRPGQ